MSDSDLTYNWQSEIAPFLNEIKSVKGGFTDARRGVVTLQNCHKVFVKVSTNSQTAKWIKKEIKTYQKLNCAGYKFTPKLLSFSADYSGFAIECLTEYNFDNVWDKNKLAAVLEAQESLKNYKDIFLDDIDYYCKEKCNLKGEWQYILQPGNIEKLNSKFKKFGIEAIFERDQINDYQQSHKNWHMDDSTLIHLDVRADNFGYNTATKHGKLVDWDWLCLGDESLDITSLFVTIFLSGFDPYVIYPEKYDYKMVIYQMGYWLTRILDSDEDSSPLEYKVRFSQAQSVWGCLQIINKYGKA